MRIEELKRWHWIVVGVVVGLALAYTWLGVEPAGTRTSSAEHFLSLLTRADPATGKPVVHDVVVHPPQANFEGKLVNRVTYSKWMKRRDGKGNEATQEHFYAPIPFVPPGRRADGADPSMTISRYLDELAKRNKLAASVSFRSGWWTTPKATYAIWTLGSVLVIGGLWPTVINGLTGAGYGRKREAKEDYFARFAHDSKPEPAKEAAPRVTPADQERLREMTDNLESRLGGFGQVQPQTAAADAKEAGAVRKLDGGPLELATAATKQDDDEIEVKGEYYPVLIHHKKQHHDAEDGAEKNA